MKISNLAIFFLAILLPFIDARRRIDPSELGGNTSFPRIIGGQPARGGQFPFAAAVYITTDDGIYFCSASLLTHEWFLTAGHCLVGATLLEVHVGTVNLEPTDTTGHILATDTYVIHPDINLNTYENDIGLIKLRIPIVFSSYILPVRVIEPSDLLGDGKTVTTIGWGQTSDEVGSLSNRLDYVFLTAISNEECQVTYGNVIKDTMVCAAGSYNEGTCIGDVGAPLVITTMGNVRNLVGISSFISANGCESVDPSGFTRTFPYMDWIKEVTEIV